MEWRKVVAIVRPTVLDKVEERLKELGVKGLTVTKVKGYGEYANFYKENWLVDGARIEIFIARSGVDAVVDAILDVAHVGTPGDGIVAVLPVERLLRIRTKAEYESPEP